MAKVLPRMTQSLSGPGVGKITSHSLCSSLSQSVAAPSLHKHRRQVSGSMNLSPLRTSYSKPRLVYWHLSRTAENTAGFKIRWFTGDYPGMVQSPVILAQTCDDQQDIEDAFHMMIIAMSTSTRSIHGNSHWVKLEGLNESLVGYLNDRFLMPCKHLLFS